MKLQVHLTPKSSNKKTGAIPVSTTSVETCPDACPFKSNGCYAGSGPLNLHWQAVSRRERGGSWKEFLGQITALPSGTFWRHNQAGDLPGDNNEIDVVALAQLTKANAGKRGFTYTHKPPTHANLYAIAGANRFGFTINLSANSMTHADELSKHGLPVVAVLDSGDVKHRSLRTPAGRKVVVCPATRIEGMSCDKCRLCSVRDREFIIGFPAHGSGAKSVNKVVAAS